MLSCVGTQKLIPGIERGGLKDNPGLEICSAPTKRMGFVFKVLLFYFSTMESCGSFLKYLKTQPFFNCFKSSLECVWQIPTRKPLNKLSLLEQEINLMSNLCKHSGSVKQMAIARVHPNVKKCATTRRASISPLLPIVLFCVKWPEAPWLLGGQACLICRLYCLSLCLTSETQFCTQCRLFEQVMHPPPSQPQNHYQRYPSSNQITK